ncbi:rho guanine nucleotide exchange factor 19-like [Pelodytes ibericus]
MALLCRKRSLADSPPSPAEVTVKRCASCPESGKPLGDLRRSRERPRLLTRLFRAKKSSKRFSSGKWNSIDDVCLRSGAEERLGQIDECNLIGPKVFSNPLYQPPESRDAIHDPPSTLSMLPTNADEPSRCPARGLFLTTENKEDGEPGPKRPEQLKETECAEQSLLGRLLKMDSGRWKRKESKFVHTQPLYQDYWVQYTKQDRKEGASVLAVNASLSFAGLLSSSLLAGSASPMVHRNYNSSLWQELPEVKGQGIIQRVNLKQRQLQEAIFEVVTSEASYQRSLTVAVCHFQKSRKLLDCLVSTDRHTLFSNLAGVRDVSERFLLDLEDELERDVFLVELGEVVMRHCPDFHRVYVPYVTNQMYQEKLMQQLVRQNGKFLQVLRKLEEQPVCKRQLLKSFLVLPFQRITRLKILLENIVKLAQGSLESEGSVRKALVSVGQIVSRCNEGVRSMMETEELVLLEKRMDFVTIKSLPLISRGRVLIQQGELAQILFQEMGVGHRPRLTTRPLYLHLFSDLLLLSSKMDNGRFLVTDYASRGHVKADHLKAKALGLPRLAFLLRLSRNHSGVSCELILQACSETAKQDWISAITSQMSSESSC